MFSPKANIWSLTPFPESISHTTSYLYKSGHGNDDAPYTQLKGKSIMPLFHEFFIFEIPGVNAPVAKPYLPKNHV